MTSGRSDPVSAPPSASIARLSFSQFATKFAEIVVEGTVDHAIRFRRAAAQALQVFEIAAMHLGAGGGERLGSRIRSRQSEHSMAGVDEFRNDG